ncbi:MAG: glycoside hydrolase family 97 protein [Thermoguttaceae bacterium]|nr:glycoside hydrolase family 97 protein [Thermoguttaceae bacterium]
MTIQRLLSCMAAVIALGLSAVYADTPVYTVASPNGDVKITVNQKDAAPTYSIEFKGKTVLNESNTGLKIRDVNATDGWKVIGKSETTFNTTWTNKFGKKSTYVDHYNQLTLTYAQGELQISYTFRAYDDGAAFRYEFSCGGSVCNEYVVEEDLTTYAFSGDFDAWVSKQKQFNSSQEEFFKKNKLSDLGEEDIVICPVVIEAPDFCAAITEADLYDWSGEKFASAAKGTTTLKTRLTPRKDKNGCVVFKTPKTSTWKVILLGEKPVDLINNSGVILNVSKPCQLEDTSWIEPAPSAWDWWTGSNKVMNTETTIDKINLAAEMGWKYMTVDDPWYYSSMFKRIKGQAPDTTRSAPNIDLDRVFAQAKEKGVRICFWLHYKDLIECGVEKTFQQYEKWGVAGVKIDFMDSEEQEMVNWLNETAALGAKYHLMVNYHGMYKPTGLERAYPNQITREGIRGNEYNKFSAGIFTDHTATLPFTRYLCGPADFTPGGTLNDQPEVFKNSVIPTHVVGTRAHEMALCIVYDSPLMTLCDAPENYRGVAGTEILKNLPSVWDCTKALDGAIGEYLVQIRRNGNVYFAGAITNTQPRKYELKLDFLKPGKTYSALIVKDVPESATDARQVKVETIDVTSDDVLTIDMVRNGGWCARFTEK